jgi:hypothetical protein
MRSEQIARLQDAVKVACAALEALLVAEFPVGARVEVLLSERQTNPSVATVTGVWGDYIQVKLDNAKQRSRRAYRRILPQCIVSVARPATEQKE